MHLPCSPASERNKDPILAVLREHLAQRHQVLEIGSGTAQHAVHFAAAFPALTWQCSDRPEYLPGIRARLQVQGLPNTPAPLALDVAREDWPAAGSFDAAYSANTLHIMGWPEVVCLFAGLDRVLARDATLVIYGPFNSGGRYTSDSNAAFDRSLRENDPRSGLRDIEAVHGLAREIGMAPVADVAMPANNRTLVWRRGGA